MNTLLTSYALMIVLLPLAGAIIAGLFGKRFGHTFTHRITVTLVGIAFFLSCYLFKEIVINHAPSFEALFYTWATTSAVHFDVAFLLDNLSVTMTMVVLFVSFMVHIYTIGYMAEDESYSRFFSYVSLFTFFMLTLVLANNFLLLFFGWEGVGLVSYLLIGFWFKRDTASAGGLKAFLVNRVGDVGFLLGIAVILMYCNTLNFRDIFPQIPGLVSQTMLLFPSFSVPVITTICCLLFIGAMAKSAQVPLHVWLPDSMEGPTPISALIHAATMVTAGIYLIARMSPLFEYSPAMLSVILVIGATTALFLGLVALVQNDIKRVIAYSTISQLGYMVVALGASAYDAAIFHLITHAFFKALLFLGAGSVIVAMHHEQDMTKMGGLAKRLPVTYITFLVGALALCAIPPFSGFYSKDIIIDAVQLSTLKGATYAYYCLLAGAFVTALYTFRAVFMTFHGKTQVEKSVLSHVKESPWVILLPLILLAVPSMIAGKLLIDPMIFAPHKLLGESIFVLPEHNVLRELAEHYEGADKFAMNAGKALAFWVSLLGIITAFIFTLRRPEWAVNVKHRFAGIYSILKHKYGFDEFNQAVFVKGTKELADTFYQQGDIKLLDGVMVDGSSRVIRFFAQAARRLQTGYLYHYILTMVMGMLILLIWLMWR